MNALHVRLAELLDTLNEPRLHPMGPLLELGDTDLGDTELCWSAEMLQLASDGSSIYVFDDPERVALQSWSAAVERTLEVSKLYLRQRPQAWRIALDWGLYRVTALLFMVFAGLNLANALLFFSPFTQVLPGMDWRWLLGWTGELTLASLVLKLALAALLLSFVSVLQRRTIALRFDAWRSKRASGWQLCSSDLTQTVELALTTSSL